MKMEEAVKNKDCTKKDLLQLNKNFGEAHELFKPLNVERDEMKEEKLVKELRERFDLPIEKFDDDMVLELTEETYGRAVIELRLKCADLGICIKDVIDETRLKMQQDIDKFLKKILK